MTTGRTEALLCHRGTTIRLPEGALRRFGRALDADMTIGDASIVDALVPPVVGQIALRDGRVTVTNLGPQLAIYVHGLGFPAVPVIPGATYGPGFGAFEIVVYGEFRHRLQVRPPSGGTRVGGEATAIAPALSPRQRAIIECALEPVRAGRSFPRSHQEVAERLNVSRNTVRLEMNNAWVALDEAGVPMIPCEDRRDEVVFAWLYNRLDEPTLDTSECLSVAR